MISILGALLGFLGSAFPEFLKLWKDRADKKHELAVLDKQIEMQKFLGTQRLEEINVQADIEETKAIHPIEPSVLEWKPTGKWWIDILTLIVYLYNSCVRPTITYAFFAVYALVKIAQAKSVLTFYSNLKWYDAIGKTWGDDDMAVFCTIIGYWFGARSMRSLMARRK